MRTAGTENGRSARYLNIRAEHRCFLSEYNLSYKSLRVFTEKRKLVFTVNLKSQFLTMLFKIRIKLFKYIELIHRFRKILYELFGERINTTELQIRCSFTKCFFCVLICYTGCDNTYFLTVYLTGALFNPVYFGGFRILAFRLESLFNNYVAALCHSGHHYILSGILFIITQSNLTLVFRFHQTARVRNPRRKTKKHRCIKLFRKTKSKLCKLIALT